MASAVAAQTSTLREVRLAVLESAARGWRHPARIGNVDAERFALSNSVQVDWKPDTPLLVTIEQAAALLNVSERTIRRLLALRELTRRKIGKRTLIPRSSLENFVKRDHATQEVEK